MEIEVNTKEIKKALATVKRTLGKGKIVPILASVRLDVSPAGELILTSTDFECMTNVKVKGTGESTSGACVVSHKALAAIIAKHGAPTAPTVTVKVEGDTLRVGAAMLSTVSAEEYPILPELVEGSQVESFDGVGLRAALVSVLPAASSKDSTRYLNGVHVEDKEDSVVFTATDGHRLHQSRISDRCTPWGEACLLPYLFVDALIHLLKGAAHVSVRRDGLLVEAVVGFATLRAKCIDGMYSPDYARMIPKPVKSRTFTLDAAAFDAALATVTPMASVKSHAVDLSAIGGQLVCKASNPDSGSAEASTPFEGTGFEEPIRFNLTYLRAALAALAPAERVTIQAGESPRHPIRLEVSGYPALVVIMPMSLPRTSRSDR